MTTIKISCGAWGMTNGLREVLSYIRPSADAVRMIVRDGRTTVINVLDGGSLRLSAKFWTSDLPPIETALAFAERSGITTLEWHIEGEFQSPSEPPPKLFNGRWAQLLFGFPAITRLSVHRFDEWVLAIALVSSGPDPTHVVPPCPLLTELAVAWQADEMATTELATRVRAVVKALESALMIRETCTSLRPLERMELFEHDLGTAPSVKDTRVVENALAPLRALVHGPVVFTRVAGLISAP